MVSIGQVAPQVAPVVEERKGLVVQSTPQTPQEKPQDLHQITHNLPEISPKSAHTLPPTPPVQHTTLTPENTQKPADLVVKTAVSTPAPWGVSDSESGLSKGKRDGSKAKKRAYTKAVSTTLPPRNPGGDSPESEEDSGNNLPTKRARLNACVAPSIQSVVAGPEVAEQRSDPTTYTAPTTEGAGMEVATSAESDEERTVVGESTTYLSPSKDEKPTTATDWSLIDCNGRSMMPVDVIVPPVPGLVAQRQTSASQPSGDNRRPGAHEVEVSTRPGSESSLDAVFELPKFGDAQCLSIVRDPHSGQRFCLITGVVLNELVFQLDQEFRDGTSKKRDVDNARQCTYYKDSADLSERTCLHHDRFLAWCRDNSGVVILGTVANALRASNSTNWSKALNTLLTTNPAALREELLPITRMDDLSLRERAQDYLRQIEEHEMAQLPIPHADPASIATHHHPMR
jgi:hypothetical protein